MYKLYLQRLIKKYWPRNYNFSDHCSLVKTLKRKNKNTPTKKRVDHIQYITEIVMGLTEIFWAYIFTPINRKLSIDVAYFNW